MSIKLKNKVVIITGSSMGIGKKTAELLANEGAIVIINGRNKEKLKKAESELNEKGIQVTAIAGDILSTEDLNTIKRTTLDKFGRIDILINNAGISSRGNFETLSEEVIQNVVDTNFIGSTKATQAFLPELKKTQGSVFFISSVAGIRGLPGVSIYCSAKMALTGLAESLKLEFSPFKVKVAIIHVGYTQNESDKRILGNDGKLIPLAERSGKNAQSIDNVAKNIVKSVKKQKFKTILSGMGKINYIFNLFFPRFVDNLLILSLKKINKMNE